MYLDTRGTLYLLKGMLNEAQHDLAEAIPLAEESFHQLDEIQGLARQPRWQRIRGHALAVMYHHRGQIHLMLGNAAEAQIDLQRGQELGYNPAEGVY